MQKMRLLSASEFAKKMAPKPRGGFLPLSKFTMHLYEDGQVLHEKENIAPVLMGIVVDYLTRRYFCDDAYKAFDISLTGARRIGQEDKALSLLQAISEEKALTTDVILAACKLVGYDVVLRAGADVFKEIEEINPDQYTCKNIAIMVRRSINFFKLKGDVFSYLRFGIPSKNLLLSGADGDYLTAREGRYLGDRQMQITLWDMKVSKEKPKSNDISQLLIYAVLMRICRGNRVLMHPSFSNDFRLDLDTTPFSIGFWNPRRGEAHYHNIGNQDQEILDKIEKMIVL